MNKVQFPKKKILLFLIILLCGGFYFFHFYSAPANQYKTEAEKDAYVRFDMEAYDSINQNYWKQASSSDLAQLFQFSLQRAQNAIVLPIMSKQDRAGVADMLLEAFKDSTSTEARKQLAVNVLNVALYNLTPQGRDQLLSSGQETQLRQEVANINPANDLYQNLGLQQGADQKSIETAYKQKASELARATTTEAQAELAKVSYAHEVLSNPNSRAIYDQTKIEPTVFSHTLDNTLYLYIDQISPNTLNEFARAVDLVSTTPKLSNMIIDLRGNIGGDLTFPQYFLGLFMGGNQYAFDLYHQGDYQVQRTLVDKFPELDRYKEYAVITDGMTQSTAELLTASLKRFHLAYVIGTKTRGWGSVENTYPIKTVIDPKEKYSLLLVNSLTLRDDNQPIEMNGVLPDVDTSVSDWKQKLSNYFNSSGMTKALIQVSASPLK